MQAARLHSYGKPFEIDDVPKPTLGPAGRTDTPVQVAAVEGVAMRDKIMFFAAVGVLAVSAHELPLGLNVSDRLRAQTPAIQIPQSLQTEHQAIHDALENATQAPGRVGAAAKELAAVLGPHFKREDEIALPPLGLLAPLAAGDKPAGIEAALAMTDALRRELPRMLEEHAQIRNATEKLRAAAREANASAQERFAEDLALHARTEEEVLYPAAILVGDVIRARMAKK